MAYTYAGGGGLEADNRAGSDHRENLSFNEIKSVQVGSRSDIDCPDLEPIPSSDDLQDKPIQISALTRDLRPRVGRSVGLSESRRSFGRRDEDGGPVRMPGGGHA